VKIQFAKSNRIIPFIAPVGNRPNWDSHWNYFSFPKKEKKGPSDGENLSTETPKKQIGLFFPLHLLFNTRL
jgi:hypothetical protein